jgi:hypothetical protein
MINLLYRVRYWIFLTFFKKAFDKSFVDTFEAVCPLVVDGETFQSGLGARSFVFEDGVEEIVPVDVTPKNTELVLRKKVNKFGREASKHYFTNLISTRDVYQYGRFDVVVHAKNGIPDGVFAVMGLATKKGTFCELMLGRGDADRMGKIMSIIRTKDKVVFKINNLTVGRDKLAKGPGTRLKMFVGLAAKDTGKGIDDREAATLKVVYWGFSPYINGFDGYNLRLRDVFKKGK